MDCCDASKQFENLFCRIRLTYSTDGLPPVGSLLAAGAGGQVEAEVRTDVGFSKSTASDGTGRVEGREGRAGG